MTPACDRQVTNLKRWRFIEKNYTTRGQVSRLELVAQRLIYFWNVRVVFIWTDGLGPRGQPVFHLI